MVSTSIYRKHGTATEANVGDVDKPLQCIVCFCNATRKLYFVPTFDSREADCIGGSRWIYECLGCGHAFVHPIPRKELASYYEDLGSEYHDLHDADVTRYEAILKVLDLSGAKRVLDWGCGKGSFLALLPPSTHRFGIEPSRRAAQLAEREGITILSPESISSAQWNQSFDVITLIDVVEHLPDPKPILDTISRGLRPGGQIVILTGDLASPAAQAAGPKWYYMHYAEHVSFFSERSVLRWLGPRFDNVQIGRITHHVPAVAAQAINAIRFWVMRTLEIAQVARPLGMYATRFVISDHMLLTATRRPEQKAT